MGVKGAVGGPRVERWVPRLQVAPREAPQVRHHGAVRDARKVVLHRVALRVDVASGAGVGGQLLKAGGEEGDVGGVRQRGESGGRFGGRRARVKGRVRV